MDESIQNDLLSGRQRAKPRRVTAENRKLFKAALSQLDAEGPPLKDRQLASIARSVKAITGVPVAETSLRELIADAGLTPPPIGLARVKRDPVSPNDEGQAKLDALRAEIATVQAVVADVKDQLAKKTVIRRLFKYLPVSIEMQTAVGLDEQAESGLAQDNPLTVDMDTGEVFGDMQHDPRDTPANVIAPEDAPDVGMDKSAPVMTFAAVMDKLTKAKTADALDEAASLIASVSNVEHQAELHAKYDALRAAL